MKLGKLAKERRHDQEVARAILPWKDARIMSGYQALIIVSLTITGALFSQMKLKRTRDGETTSYHWSWIGHSETTDPALFLGERYPTAKIIKRRKPTWKRY